MTDDCNIVFLPWRGEFGQMIMHHVRHVHWTVVTHDNPGEVVVCCRRGDEALFPDATKFYYDWEQVPDKRKNTRLLKSKDNVEYLDCLAKHLGEVFGEDSFFFSPPKRLDVLPKYNFKPRPSTVLGELEIDVLLCPRWREHGKHRNYRHWEEVASLLQSAGLTVALAGMKQTSVDVLTVPEELKTWNYDNLDSTLHFMNRAKVVVASDAGLAHLAVLNQSPLFVIYDQPGKEAGKPKWPWALPHMQKYAMAKCDPIIGGWNSPEVVVEKVCEYLGATVEFATVEVGHRPEPRRQNLLICSMVYEYQKRYWWQLSSLLQQEPWEGQPIPNICAHADISARDPNYGWNDTLYRTFNGWGKNEDGRTFKHTQRKWPRVDPAVEDPYGKRGHIRSDNIQMALREEWADWILFNDADMVYDPRFFSHLMTLIDADEEKVYATPRWTMLFEDGYRIVDSVKYRHPIEDPVSLIKAGVTKPMWQSARGRISGAGFFQLISVRALKKRAAEDKSYLEYVPDTANRDRNTLLDIHITTSDRKFRHRLGGIVPLPNIMPQYHLNHWRKDSDEYVEGMLH